MSIWHLQLCTRVHQFLKKTWIYYFSLSDFGETKKRFILSTTLHPCTLIKQKSVSVEELSADSYPAEILKTNHIGPRSAASRTNMLALRTPNFKVPMKWNFSPLFYSRQLKSMLHWFIIFEFGLQTSAYEFFLELQSWPIWVKMCDIPRAVKICKLVRLTS